MNRAWLRTGMAVLLGVAVVGGGRRATACTPVKALTPAAVVWPRADALLAVGSSLLFRQREADAFLRTDGAEPRVELQLQQVLSPLRPAAPLAFFRPTRPLVAGESYELTAEGGQLSVPFTVHADALRVGAAFTVSVRERTVPEASLTSATCYSGPLADRPYTRVADVVVTVMGAAALGFAVSLDTLDSLTGALIEDAVLHDGGAAARLELPLPPGVADCLRVRVWDFSGVVVVDEASLCVTPEGEERRVQASVFLPTSFTLSDPVPAPGPPEGESAGAPSGAQPSEPEPVPTTRTSKGCQLSPSPGSWSSGAGIFGLGGLLLALRRPRR